MEQILLPYPARIIIIKFPQLTRQEKYTGSARLIVGLTLILVKELKKLFL